MTILDVISLLGRFVDRPFDLLRFNLSLADGTCAGVVCAVDADCVTSSSGDKVCECKSGYSGDGRSCRGMYMSTANHSKCYGSQQVSI